MTSKYLAEKDKKYITSFQNYSSNFLFESIMFVCEYSAEYTFLNQSLTKTAIFS